MRMGFQLCASFAVGLIAASWCGYRWCFALAICLAIGAVACLLLRRHSLLKKFCILLLAGSLGAGWFCGYAFAVQQPALRLINSSHTLRGTLSDQTVYEDSSSRIFLSVNQVDDQTWFPPLTIKLYAGQPLQSEYGDTVTTTTTLTPTADNTEFGLFDSDAADNCLLSGELSNETVVSPGWTIQGQLLKLRDRLVSGIERTIAYPQSDIVSGILFGIKSDIPYHTMRTFNRAGIAHILAVSGLHVSILAAMLAVLLRALRCPKRVAFLLLAAVLFCFCGMAGFTPSAMRAGIMAALTAFGVLRNKPIGALEALSAAAAILLLLQPSTGLGLSFILSFSACLGILLFSRRITLWLQRQTGWFGRLGGGLLSALSISASAMLLSTPAMALSFGTVPLLSPISSLLVVPLLPPFFICSLLAAVLGLFLPTPGIWFGYIAEGIVGGITAAADWISGLPFCVLPANYGFILPALLACLLLLLLALFSRRVPGVQKVCACFCVLVWLACMGEHQLLAANAIEIAVLGNGFASTTIISSGNRAVVFNCGNGRWGAQKACQFLDSRGVTRIQALICTSGDQAHASGSVVLMQEIPTELVCLPQAMQAGTLAREAERAGIPTTYGNTEIQTDNFILELSEATGEMGILIRKQGINIAFAESVTAIEALASTQILQLALVDAPFDGWYRPDLQLCAIALQQQEQLPENTLSAPPNQTSEFIVRNAKVFPRPLFP